MLRVGVWQQERIPTSLDAGGTLGVEGFDWDAVVSGWVEEEKGEGGADGVDLVSFFETKA